MLDENTFLSRRVRSHSVDLGGRQHTTENSHSQVTFTSALRHCLYDVLFGNSIKWRVGMQACQEDYWATSSVECPCPTNSSREIRRAAIHFTSSSSILTVMQGRQAHTKLA